PSYKRPTLKRGTSEGYAFRTVYFFHQASGKAYTNESDVLSLTIPSSRNSALKFQIRHSSDSLSPLICNADSYIPPSPSNTLQITLQGYRVFIGGAYKLSTIDTPIICIMVN